MTGSTSGTLPLLVRVRVNGIGWSGGTVVWPTVFTPVPLLRCVSTARVAQALPEAVPVLSEVSAWAR